MYSVRVRLVNVIELITTETVVSTLKKLKKTLIDVCMEPVKHIVNLQDVIVKLIQNIVFCFVLKSNCYVLIL